MDANIKYARRPLAAKLFEIIVGVPLARFKFGARQQTNRMEQSQNQRWKRLAAAEKDAFQYIRMTRQKTIDDMLDRLNADPPKTDRSSFKDILGFDDKRLEVPKAIIKHAKNYRPLRPVVHWNSVI